MPIYEYKCDACEAKFEKLIRRETDELELSCPSCGEHRLSQQYSTFAPHAGASHSGRSAAPEPQCPSGMCRNPGMCGMN